MARNKYLSLILLFAVILGSGESAPKSNRYEDYIVLAIGDFLKSSPLSKRDTVFSVWVKEFNDEIVGVSIYGSTMKTFVLRNGNDIDVSTLPTRCFDTNGKLFYWDDKEISLTPEVIATLKKYNFIDTAIKNIYIPPFVIDDGKKGEDYFFCKHNIRKFKKVRTKLALGSYPVPKLDCDR